MCYPFFCCSRPWIVTRWLSDFGQKKSARPATAFHSHKLTLHSPLFFCKRNGLGGWGSVFVFPYRFVHCKYNTVILRKKPYNLPSFSRFRTNFSRKIPEGENSSSANIKVNNKYKKVILPKEAVLMLAFLFNSFFHPYKYICNFNNGSIIKNRSVKLLL